MEISTGIIVTASSSVFFAILDLSLNCSLSKPAQEVEYLEKLSSLEDKSSEGSPIKE